MNIGELIWKIKGDTKDIDKATKKTETGITKLGKIMLAAFTGAALIAGIRKLTGFLKSAGDAAAVQESAVRRLGAALEVTGQAGGNALSDLQEFASELQQITVIGDEATLALLQTAINMGLNTEEAKTATEQAIALSRAYGIDAKTALLGVTNTMKGQTSTLTRYIPSLKLATDATERMAILNNEAARAMAIATAETETAEGTLTQLNNALGDSQELIGNYVNQHLTPWRSKLLEIVTELNNAQAAQQNLDAAVAGASGANIAAALETQREKVDELKSGIEEGGRAAQTLARHYETSIKNLDQILFRETMILANMSKRAGEANVLNMEEQESVNLAIEKADKETESARLAVEAAEAQLSASKALQDNEARTAELFEERAQAQRDALADRTNAVAEALYAERTAEEERHEQRIANLQAELAAASQYAGNVGTIFNNLIQIQMAGDEELTDQKKRNIITLYRIQQAANIAQIAVDTAAGIVKAWASPGFPLAIPLTALIAGIGITQAAVVAATPPPVALAEGGVFPARPGGTNAIIGEGGVDEQVTVTPLDGGAGQMTLTVIIHDEALIGPMQVNLDSRNVIVDAGSVTGL